MPWSKVFEHFDGYLQNVLFSIRDLMLPVGVASNNTRLLLSLLFINSILHRMFIIHVLVHRNHPLKHDLRKFVCGLGFA